MGIRSTRVGELARGAAASVVVGIDRSNPSERALYYAFGLAHHKRSQVIVVHAVRVTTSEDLLVSASLASPAEGDFHSQMEQSVHALAREHGVEARFASVVGNPVGVIFRLAREERADAIILGASRTFGPGRAAGKCYGRRVAARRQRSTGR